MNALQGTLTHSDVLSSCAGRDDTLSCSIALLTFDASIEFCEGIHCVLWGAFALLIFTIFNCVSRENSLCSFSVQISTLCVLFNYAVLSKTSIRCLELTIYMSRAEARAKTLAK